MKKKAIIILIVSIVAFSLGWVSNDLYKYVEAIKHEGVRLNNFGIYDSAFGENIVQDARLEALLRNDTNFDRAIDVNGFVVLSDILLTSISGKEINLVLSNETTSTPAFAMRKIDFDPGKGNRNLRFWIKHFVYSDTENCISDFIALRKEANGDAGDDGVPGLTYSNDYVLRSDKQIFWLNTGCAYAYSNHLMIKQNLLQSLNNVPISDSISCKCGQPNCKE